MIELDPHFNVLLGDNNKGGCGSKKDVEDWIIIVPVVVGSVLLVVATIFTISKYEKEIIFYIWNINDIV